MPELGLLCVGRVWTTTVVVSSWEQQPHQDFQKLTLHVPLLATHLPSLCPALTQSSLNFGDVRSEVLKNPPLWAEHLVSNSQRVCFPRRIPKVWVTKIYIWDNRENTAIFGIVLLYQGKGFVAIHHWKVMPHSCFLGCFVGHKTHSPSFNP